MKKKTLMASVAIALAASMTMSSCIGSFSLTNKLLTWNRNIDSKFVNELVFLAFWILPVYEVSTLADLIVINSIEFWSGSSPIEARQTIVEGNDGKYLVQRDSQGYTVTSLNDGSEMRLNFHVDEQTWTVVGTSGKEYPLITFIDDTHVKTPGIDGQMHVVELQSPALYAAQ